MAFRFPLETVLRVRESIEKREEAALQKVLAEMARVRRSIEELTEQIHSSYAARQQAMQRPTPAYQLESMLSETHVLAGRRKALVDSLPLLEQQRQDCMRAYQLAHQNRQMLTDMRTRQRDAWEESRARTQQKFLDDIFAARRQRT